VRHLGVLRGSGQLESGGQSMGRADYEFDGYQVHPGQIVGSGEIHMNPELLNNAFGRNDLVLRTDDGHTLSIRFSGKMLAPTAGVAHADVREGLPAAKAWQRR